MARPFGIALLLSRLGAHTSARFAERVGELGLTPEHVAVLRVVGQRPGLSQRELASALGTLPSKVVRLVDDLEGKGLLERRRSEVDRRNHALHVAGGADERLGQVLATVIDHDADITRGLTGAEKKTLAALLGRMAAEQGLDRDGDR